MKKTLTLLSIFYISAWMIVAQDQIVTLPDGTKVVIKPNRTWEPLVESKKPAQSGAKSMLKVIPDKPSDSFAALMGLGKQLDKSEFETEKQYIERIKKLADETRVPTAAGRRLSDTVFFFRDLSTYDAEKQRFRFSTVGILFNSLRHGIDRQNYKVTFVIRRYGRWTEDILGIEIPDLQMPASEAQNVKPSLAVAIYGLPVGYEGSEVKLLAKHLIVFNMSTGEVYSEQDVSQREVEP